MLTNFLRFITETYSKDKEEIIEFLDELPEKLTLYRALFLVRGEKINKKKLGESWTLDYSFAQNSYHYQSFLQRGDSIMKIIHLEIPKSFIDIDKTIDRRLITDNEKYFWDELTGEWTENTDLDYHSYEHEDEIVLKDMPELQKYITKIETIPLENGLPKKKKQEYHDDTMFDDF